MRAKWGIFRLLTHDRFFAGSARATRELLSALLVGVEVLPLWSVLVSILPPIWLELLSRF